MPSLTAARLFLRTHGRLLERRLAEVHLDAAGPAGARAVLAALGGYGNADGGFGHGLEPDATAPDSQPLAVDFGFEVLDELVAHLPAGHPVRAAAAELAGGAVEFLAGVAAPSGGVPIVLPSVADHPRAAHWGDGRFPPALNPTASIVARARLFGLTHPWVETAAVFCRRQLDQPDAVGDAHTARCVLRFLETEPDQAWAKPAYEELGARINDLALFHPRPGDGYGMTPLDFAPRPDHPRRRFFPDDAVEAHLAALAAAQQADGGWSLSWEPPGPAAELAWRGVVTLAAVRTLTAYTTSATAAAAA